MAECRSIRISEGLWVQLKQRALDERVTLREVLERAAHQYLGPLKTPAVEIPRTVGSPVPGTDGPSKELTYTDDD